MLKLTRQELYDLDWAEAVDKVAKRFFISGAGLRKICLKHDVPVPPRGYWARVAAGQKVKQPKLPSPQTADKAVYLPKRTERPNQPPALPDTGIVQEQREFEANPKNRIEVRPNDRRVHPWAKGLRKQLNYSGTSYWRDREERPPSPLSVSASSGVADRIVQIIDALGRAAVKRNASLVEVPLTDRYHPRTETQLSFQDTSFRLSLSERTRRIRRAPGDEALDPIRPSWFATPTKTYRFEPTGELRLTITGTVTTQTNWNRHYPIHKEITLKDKPGNPLEQQLHEVFITMTAIAAHLHEERRQWEEQRRLEELERARQAELARQREAAAQRLKELEGLADRHARAIRLRQLIAAVESTGVIPVIQGAPVELEAWLAWARLDPVIKS